MQTRLNGTKACRQFLVKTDPSFDHSLISHQLVDGVAARLKVYSAYLARTWLKS
ncbi:uncharacterized protein BDW70DRAFT_134149 [Aspergillus foveolatus]|uniref:uncharacterized protein n=1 Tax=Aspergillus foveolatus TaxID=210207 RepID=UPI003CCDF7BF